MGVWLRLPVWILARISLVDLQLEIGTVGQCDPLDEDHITGLGDDELRREVAVAFVLDELFAFVVKLQRPVDPVVPDLQRGEGDPADRAGVVL